MNEKIETVKTTVDKKVILSFIIPVLLQVTLFVFQAVNGIVSVWNVISTAMIVGIFVLAIKSAKVPIKNEKINDIDGRNDSSNEIKVFKPKRNIKTIIIQLIAIVLSVVISIVCFVQFGKRSKDIQVIDAKIISQWGDTTIVTEWDDDGDLVKKEYDYFEIVVEYEFNGKMKTSVLSGKNTNKILVDEIKIFVDDAGELVSDYGRVIVWKIEAIILICFALLLLMLTIFSAKVEIYAGVIATFIGAILAVLIGSPIIENFFYNDIVCFLFMFINVGIFWLTAGVVSIIDENKKQARASLTGFDKNKQ